MEKGDLVKLSQLAKDRGIDLRADRNRDRLGTVVSWPSESTKCRILWDNKVFPDTYAKEYIEKVG